MSHITAVLIVAVLALLPSRGSAQELQQLQSTGYWTQESRSYVYHFRFDVPLKTGAQGKILWTLKQSPTESDRSKIDRQATEYVRVEYIHPDGAFGLVGIGKSDPYGIIGLDQYRLQLSGNRTQVFGSTAAGGGWSGRIESRADNIPSQLDKANFRGSERNPELSDAPRPGNTMSCEEARRTACVPANAIATASVMCTAVRDGCEKVADTHRNISDRTIFRSFCQAHLTDLDRSTFKTSQILSRYRYNTAPTDGAAEIGKEIGGLYGAAVQLLAGAMGAGIRAGQGNTAACEAEYEAACRQAHKEYEARCR